MESWLTVTFWLPFAPVSMSLTPLMVSWFEVPRLPLTWRPLTPPTPPAETFAVETTPGISFAMSRGLRPLTWIFSTCLPVMVAERSTLSVCRVAAEAETSIDSVTAPTCSVRSPSESLSLASRAVFFRSSFLKPAASTAIV